MALLSNINDKFAVDSTGAIQFNGQVGTSGYVLKSNANAAPTWVDPSTVIGGPYLPLSGGTLTGALAGTSAAFAGTISAVGASTFTLNDGVFIKAVNGTNNVAATNVWGYGLYEGTSKLGEISLVRDGSSSQMYMGTTGANQVLRIGSANKVTALTIDASQNATFAGNIILGDTPQIQLGTNNDAQIDHTGFHLFIDNSVGNSYLRNTSTGSIILRNSTGGDIQFDNEFAGNILFNTSNIERMRIDSSGNLGVFGNTNPSCPIDFGTTVANDKRIIGTYVNGNLFTGIGMSPTTAGIRIAGDLSANNLLDIGYYSNDGNYTWSSTMFITNGNVGIGTVSPDYNLEIEATDAKAFVHYVSASRGGIAAYSSQRIAFTTTGSSDDLVFGYNNGATATSANFVEYMRIDNGTGYVGIGTSSPGEKLVIRETSNTAATRIKIEGGSYGFTLGKTTQAANYVHLRPGSNSPAVFRIMPNVGPNYSYMELWGTDFESNTTNYNRLMFYINGSTGDANIKINKAGSSPAGSLYIGTASSEQAITIVNSGNVGIGTTPTQPLDVDGYSICDKQFQRDNTLLTILNTPRVLNIGYRGPNGTYTFDPTTLFGSLAQGGQCTLEVTGWRAALNNGIIHWADNGSNTNIGAGQVYYTQTAYRAGGQSGSNLISVSNTSGTNNITITFTGWHSNSHGWNCKIISYQA